MENNKRLIKQHMRRIRLRTILAVLVILALMVIFALKAPAFNVSKFEVNGNKYYTDDEIANMGNCNLGVNIFTGVDCGDIRDRLMKDPYMVRVSVRRKLPSTITINLTERTQTAGFRTQRTQHLQHESWGAHPGGRGGPVQTVHGHNRCDEGKQHVLQVHHHLTD